MGSDDEGVKGILPLSKDADPKREINPGNHHVPPVEPAVEEPWFCEAVEVLDDADVKEVAATIPLTWKPLPMGMKTEPIDLFEGPSKCRCCINWVKEKPDDVKENLEETDELKQHVIIVRRKKSHQKYSREPLEIDSIVVNSSLIKAALEEIFNNYPAFDMETENWTFQAPFEGFFHHWDELNAFVESGTSDTTVHMEVLRNVLLPVLGEPFSLSKNLISHGLISYELLWTLFKPGQSIYYSDPEEGGEEYLFVLSSSRYKQGDGDKEPNCSLTSTMVDWDGNTFGRADMLSVIKHFEGSKSITELPVYPLEFVKDKETVKSRLLKRGRRFEQLAGISYVAYRGIARRRQKYRDVVDFETNMLLDERIMIDASSYYRESSHRRHLDPLNSVPKRQLRNHHSYYEFEEVDDDDEQKLPKIPLTDALRMNCSPWVKGYALKSKQWVSVLVAGVTDICWNNDVFDNLVLDQGYKKLIRGFVQSRVDKHEVFDDFIDGKGRGIVMLLSGPPGVGKTLTAEATAEDLHAPLYSFSAGQLGLDAESVEKRLREVLQLCESWAAVLLLDEADVFLQQRTIHDLERNRLVSIFLRTLEYFEGVLFLTTNRLSDFDTAIESRIDFTLEFPELDYDSRLRIWKNPFAKVKLPVSLQDCDYKELAHVELNGRRIKNIIKSATVIAGNENGSAVQRAHVNTILEVFVPKS